MILDRDALKWFRPALGQFGISYRDTVGLSDYQPDFAAETNGDLLILEVKAARNLKDATVLAKRAAAVHWCCHASAYTAAHGGKPWSYILVPDEALAENVNLEALIPRFRCKPDRRQ